MFTAKQFRQKAAESAESLKHTDVPSEIRKLERAKQSFSALAENEDWLATNFDKVIHSPNIPTADEGVEEAAAHVTNAEVEERVLSAEDQVKAANAAKAASRGKAHHGRRT